MWLQAIRLGYSRRDLMEMTVAELLWDFEAVAADEPKQDGGTTREATQEDIRRMLA